MIINPILHDTDWSVNMSIHQWYQLKIKLTMWHIIQWIAIKFIFSKSYIYICSLWKNKNSSLNTSITINTIKIINWLNGNLKNFVWDNMSEIKKWIKLALFSNLKLTQVLFVSGGYHIFMQSSFSCTNKHMHWHFLSADTYTTPWSCKHTITITSLCSKCQFSLAAGHKSILFYLKFSFGYCKYWHEVT